MTLSELLEELRDIDPGTWQDIQNYIEEVYYDINPFTVYGDPPMLLDLIQGDLQRAIERREWDLRQDQWIVKRDGPNDVHHYAEVSKGIAFTGDPIEYEGRGKSPAEAILAAYIAAVKEEKQ
jgi:hypothetical protein